jgi:hypothetical protein
MKKIDYKSIHKEFYAASSKEVVFIDVPEMNFFMIDGHGDPNTSKEYSDAVEALYSLSYTIKFMIKKELEIDYGVMPLEGLWWAENMSSFTEGRKDEWDWTSMIMQPEPVTQEWFDKGLHEVARKKDLPGLGKVRFASFAEGRSAQIMHIGPFSEEGPTIKKVHDFIEASGYSLRGEHHEIYLSDIRRAAPEKWKTIVRQPC